MGILKQSFIRADSMFVPSQWEKSLQRNAVSHWLGANLESVLLICPTESANKYFLALPKFGPQSTTRVNHGKHTCAHIYVLVILIVLKHKETHINHKGAKIPTCSWWRLQMETFSALLAICAGNSPVPGEFPTQRPVTRNFGVFFDLRLNKWLSKQS